MVKLLLFIILTAITTFSCGERSTSKTDQADSLSLNNPDSSISALDPLLINNPIQTSPAQKDPLKTPTGLASYYADRFHGRKTSNGEIYDTTKYTAAHRTLPFGTLVKVTNLRTGQEVVVKVNDRGPHNKNRIIDVSKAAAKELGMLRRGLSKVKLEIVKK